MRVIKVFLICLIFFQTIPLLSEEYYQVKNRFSIIDSDTNTIYSNRIITHPNANIEIFQYVKFSDRSNRIENYYYLLQSKKDTVLMQSSNASIFIYNIESGVSILSPIFIDQNGDTLLAEDIMIEASSEKSSVIQALENTKDYAQTIEADLIFKNNFPILAFIRNNNIVLAIIGGIVLILAIALTALKISRTRKKQNIERTLEIKSLEVASIAHDKDNLEKEIERYKTQLDKIESRANRLKEENQVLIDCVDKITQKKKDLEDLQKQKEELLTMVLHDIGNPVAIIKNLVELLTSYDMSAMDQADIINQISKSTSYIINLSKEISNVLVLDSPDLQLHTIEANVNGIAGDVYTRNKVRTDKKRQEFLLQLDDSIRPISLEPHKIDEILDNLVSNAIKYTQKEGTIKLITKQLPDKVAIIVEDNGLGISDADLKDLFQKGKRLSTKPTDGESSTGFGLWIVKKLTEAHGGQIYIKSSVGAGSKFTVHLPLTQDNNRINK